MPRSHLLQLLKKKIYIYIYTHLYSAFHAKQQEEYTLFLSVREIQSLHWTNPNLLGSVGCTVPGTNTIGYGRGEEHANPMNYKWKVHVSVALPQTKQGLSQVFLTWQCQVTRRRH